MSTSTFTGNHDAVLQLNSRNLEALLEQQIGGLLRIFRAGIELPTPMGARFDYADVQVGVWLSSNAPWLDLELRFVEPTLVTAGARASLGARPARYSLAVRLDVPPYAAEDSSLSLELLFDWTVVRLAVDDPAGLGADPDAQLAVIRTALTELLRPLLSPDDGRTRRRLTTMTRRPDSVPDPAPGDPVAPGMARFQLRHLDTSVGRRGAATVDAVSLGVRLLQAPWGPISAPPSTVGPLQDGALIVHNGLLFTMLADALMQAPPAGLGLRGLSVTPMELLLRAPEDVSVGGNSIRVVELKLTASGNTIVFQGGFHLDMGISAADITATGPITFAFDGSGRLVIGVDLTTSMSTHITGWGVAGVIGLAIIGAIIGAFTGGAGGVAAGAIGAGIGASAALILSAAASALITAIQQLIPGNLENALAGAIVGAGGAVLPPGLLDALGATMGFSPPILFDDLALGCGIIPIHAVRELGRNDGVAIGAAQGFDLDTHAVIAWDAAAADVVWAWSTLVAGAGAVLAIVDGDVDFAELGPDRLEAALRDAAGGIPGSMIPRVDATGAIPAPLVLAARTNRGRLAKLAVWRDPDGRLVVRDVVFDTLAPNARIAIVRPGWAITTSRALPDTPPSSPFDQPRHNYEDGHRASFTVATHRIPGALAHHWSLDGHGLAGAGTVTIGASTVQYAVDGATCTLTLGVGVSLSGELGCTVTGDGASATAALAVAASGTRSVAYGQSQVETYVDSIGRVIVRPWRDDGPGPDPAERGDLVLAERVAFSAAANKFERLARAERAVQHAFGDLGAKLTLR